MPNEEEGPKQESLDMGLGLDEFLGETEPETSEGDVVEPSGEAKPEEEAKPADDSPSGEEPKEDQPKGEAKPEEVSEEKPEGEAKENKISDKDASKWDSDDNPYKQQALVNEKRYRDTVAWANQNNQARIELQRQLDIINKKLDGTYDPDTDAAPQVSQEQVLQQSELVGRIIASEEIVANQLGREAVDRRLAEFTEYAKERPELRQQVLASTAPAITALQILEERDFKAKYGTTEAQIKEKIRAEYKDELMKEVREEESRKMKERLSLKDKQANGLSGVRGSTSQAEPDEETFTPLEDIFAQ